MHSKSSSNTATIDVHAHLLLPTLHKEVVERAPLQIAEAEDLELRRNGEASLKASATMIQKIIPQLTEVSARLKVMDEQGIDHQWVSVSPNHFYPWANEELSLWIAQETNRLVALHVQHAPDRLTGFGVVPLQHPSQIVECVDNAVLEHGLAGVEISSFAGSIELSDERLDPFWSRMEELGAIVFLHPFGCSLDERLNRYYLSNTVGQPTENAVALSHLIFSGVLDRFPDLIIVAAHGGGYLPSTIGRSDRAWRVRPESRGCIHPPSTYLKKLWFDTVLHNPVELRHLVESVGASQVVLGSDFPFDMGMDTPVEDILAAGLSDEDTPLVLGANASSLLDKIKTRNSLDFN